MNAAIFPLACEKASSPFHRRAHRPAPANHPAALGTKGHAIVSHTKKLGRAIFR